jgi:hypothetical protein
MKRHLTIFAALAMNLTSSAFAPSLKADEWDKKTTISISQPIAVKGTILPAGQYVLRRDDSIYGRDVVYIFNSKGTRLITTVVAIHAYRLDATNKSEFSFYASSAGQPAALHTWFFPGDNYGFEFLQRQNPVAAEFGAAGN